MELRYLKEILVYGDMFFGEKNVYKTTLQHRTKKKDGIWGVWINVKTESK